jgi:lipoyl(octanoyl) transferase
LFRLFCLFRSFIHLLLSEAAEHRRTPKRKRGVASPQNPSCAVGKMLNAESYMLNARWLGRISFADALALQEEIVARKGADASAPDELLLLEHEPVYTIGRTPDQSSLRDPGALPHPVVRTNRGGQATYHGPGQLVGYPILDLRVRGQDLHRYLRGLEEVLITLLRDYGIAAQRSPGQTGVWVGGRKIASIGVGVRRWISMHGFALNVGGDLAPFTVITPCGIAGVEMTSVSRECGREVTVREVAERVAPHFDAFDKASLLAEGGSEDGAKSRGAISALH